MSTSAVIYLRISSDPSGERAGVDRQREDCLVRCRDRGWTVTEVLVDNDISAAGGKHRPGFEAVVRAVTEGQATVVVAWALDRLQRNRRDELRLYEACREAGASLSLVNGTDVDFSSATGRFIADSLGSIARLEIEMKSDRQRRAAQQQAERGLPTRGRRPFGFDRDGVTVRRAEAVAIRDGYTRLLTGSNLAEIARDWNARGLTTGQNGRATRQPSPWRPDAVRHVLRNARNAGLRDYKGSLYKAQWPALVTRETWQAAVDLLSDPGRRSGPAQRSRTLLSGVATCGVCGATIQSGGNGRPGIPGYRCSASMGHFARMAAPVDDYVSAVAVARLSRPDAAELLADPDRVDLDALRTEATALRERLDSAAAAFADGEIDHRQLKTITGRVRDSLAAVESELADAARVDVLGPLVAAADVQAAWDALDISRRRAVIDTLMNVVVHPVGRGTRTFRPETVVVSPKAAR